MGLLLSLISQIYIVIFLKKLNEYKMPGNGIKPQILDGFINDLLLPFRMSGG